MADDNPSPVFFYGLPRSIGLRIGSAQASVRAAKQSRVRDFESSGTLALA